MAKVPTKTAPPAAAAAVAGKLGTLLTLLQRPTGATITQMTEATAWQAHSVRGAMAGALKKRGFAVTSEKADGVRVYSIAPAPKVQP